MADSSPSSSRPRELTSAQRKAAEASNYPHQDVYNAVRKFTKRISQTKGDRIEAVLRDNLWKAGDEGPPSRPEATGGRERIFCASIVYFELIEEGRDPATDADLQKICAKMGELIRSWTYYEFPIAKQPAVSRYCPLNS